MAIQLCIYIYIFIEMSRKNGCRDAHLIVLQCLHLKEGHGGRVKNIFGGFHIYSVYFRDVEFFLFVFFCFTIL